MNTLTLISEFIKANKFSSYSREKMLLMQNKPESKNRKDADYSSIKQI